MSDVNSLTLEDHNHPSLVGGEQRARAGSVCDPGRLAFLSDPPQSEEPEQSRQRAAEEIQVPPSEEQHLTLSYLTR